MPKSYLSAAQVNDLVGKRLGYVQERGRHLARVSGEDYSARFTGRIKYSYA